LATDIASDSSKLPERTLVDVALLIAHTVRTGFHRQIQHAHWSKLEETRTLPIRVAVERIVLRRLDVEDRALKVVSHFVGDGVEALLVVHLYEAEALAYTSPVVKENLGIGHRPELGEIGAQLPTTHSPGNITHEQLETLSACHILWGCF